MNFGKAFMIGRKPDATRRISMKSTIPGYALSVHPINQIPMAELDIAMRWAMYKHRTRCRSMNKYVRLEWAKAAEANATTSLSGV